MESGSKQVTGPPQSLQPRYGARYRRKRGGPDLHEALAHLQALVVVPQADGAAKELRNRAAHIVGGVQYEEGVLQLADFFMRPVDLDGMRITREQGHHAGRFSRDVIGIVHDDEKPARTARGEKALEPRDAIGVVHAQRGKVRVEDAELPPELVEQAVDGGLESRPRIEALVKRLFVFFHARARSRRRYPRRCQR